MCLKAVDPCGRTAETEDSCSPQPQGAQQPDFQPSSVSSVLANWVHQQVVGFQQVVDCNNTPLSPSRPSTAAFVTADLHAGARDTSGEPSESRRPGVVLNLCLPLALLYNEQRLADTSSLERDEIHFRGAMLQRLVGCQGEMIATRWYSVSRVFLFVF